MTIHSEETLARLARWDTPTLSNAIERFDVRPHTSGFTGYDIRCVYPSLPSMLGYAVTCTAESTREEPDPDAAGLEALWEALNAAPKPAVLVIEDVGSDRRRSCHLGEVMATTAKALGAVGCVCDGGLRDIKEIEELGAFQLFCPGFVASHGRPVIFSVGGAVEISGLEIDPGDLLHGDLNGLLKIPHEVVENLEEEARRVRDLEARFLELARSEDFTLERLRALKEELQH